MSRPTKTRIIKAVEITCPYCKIVMGVSPVSYVVADLKKSKETGNDVVIKCYKCKTESNIKAIKDNDNYEVRERYTYESF